MPTLLEGRPAGAVNLVAGRLCLDFVNSVGARRVSTSGEVTIRDEKLSDYLELLTKGDLTRLRQCQGDDCGWIFEDASRNRGRRWCDMRDCGNIAKVRRFRTRQNKNSRQRNVAPFARGPN